MSMDAHREFGNSDLAAAGGSLWILLPTVQSCSASWLCIALLSSEGP